MNPIQARRRKKVTWIRTSIPAIRPILNDPRIYLLSLLNGEVLGKIFPQLKMHSSQTQRIRDHADR